MTAPVRPAFFELRRVSSMSAAVTLAVSQPLFNLILQNLDEFPLGGLFHLWVLVWAFFLPVLGLILVDTLLERARPDRPVFFQAWRGVLYAAVAVSLLHQGLLHYFLTADQWGLPRSVGPIQSFALILIAVTALTVTISLKHPAPLRRYLAVLGPLAAFFVASYVARSGLWGPAWVSVGADSALAPPAAAETPVFVVVFDELSQDVLLKDGRIDPESFPHFSAFAAENAWYARASTNHLATVESIPCMLTGKRLPTSATPSLFYHLQGRYVPTLVGGWLPMLRWTHRGARDAVKLELRGSIEETSRHPLEAAKILASCLWKELILGSTDRERRGYTHILNATSPAKHPGLVADVVARRTGPGLFVYWHCTLPHTPFIYDARGNPSKRRETSFLPEMDPEKVFQNYREQVMWTDVLFGRFLDVLRKAGIYDRAIILVTSDHGLRAPRALQPAGYPAVMNGLTPWVPLFLKAPGLRAGRHDDDYQHVDLVPTLLDLLRVPHVPGDFDGVSLFAAERPARPRTISLGDVEYVFDSPSGLWRLLPR